MRNNLGIWNFRALTQSDSSSQGVELLGPSGISRKVRLRDSLVCEFVVCGLAVSALTKLLTPVPFQEDIIRDFKHWEAPTYGRSCNSTSQATFKLTVPARIVTNTYNK